LIHLKKVLHSIPVIGLIFWFEFVDGRFLMNIDKHNEILFSGNISYGYSATIVINVNVSSEYFAWVYSLCLKTINKAAKSIIANDSVKNAFKMHVR
jgi:hypothetical protein